ncbi:MAG: flavin reductase [Proteobacteria bacterium]|nr:MAG: flavin reductase [Pseudomonadota bacterium]
MIEETCTNYDSLPDLLPVPDQRELRNAFGRFATGVCVVTTRNKNDAPVGITVNSFSALSLSPPLVLWCLADTAWSRAAFEQAEYFAVNVLSAHQHEVSKNFATSRADKFSGAEWRPGIGGAPLLAGTLARFECRRSSVLVKGDHLLFVGRVERFSYDDGSPLLFSAGRYGEIAEVPG